jgi:hypothetical protein
MFKLTLSLSLLLTASSVYAKKNRDLTLDRRFLQQDPLPTVSMGEDSVSTGI